MIGEIRGLAAGLGLFYIHVSVETERGGWSGSKQFPSFWTVGGTPFDAIHNALSILDIDHGDHIGNPADDAVIQRFTVAATSADFDGEHVTVSYDSQNNWRRSHEHYRKGGVFEIHGVGPSWWDGIVSYGDGKWFASLRYADGTYTGRTQHGTPTEALTAVVSDLKKISSEED